MKIQNILQRLSIVTALLLCTAPVFAQIADLAKITTEGMLKSGLSEAALEAAYKQIALLSERSLELYMAHGARFENAVVGTVVKEELWPDYRELTDMFAIYRQLLTSGNVDKLARIQDPAVRSRVQLLYVPPEQHFLTRLHQEESAFTNEISAANLFWKKIQMASLQRKIFQPETDKEFAATIRSFPSARLRRDLLQALQEKDFKALEGNLREYYSLGMDDVTAASKYAQRHPHGRNLALRRLLLNPFVPETFKTYIKTALSTEQLEGASSFENVLRQAFRSQQELKKFLAQSKTISTKLEKLDAFIDNVESFLQQNGRLPSMSNPDERAFALECSTFQFGRRYDQLASKYYYKFDRLLKQYNIDPNTLR